MKILIAEDELPLANTLKKNFVEEGHQAEIALDGEETVTLAAKTKFDVIVLDWRMPKLTGLEVLKQLKISKNETPVILLTALSRISNKVEALELGADDYLTKPFSFEELLARIKAVLRRSQSSLDILTFNGISLNLITRKAVTANLHEIKLTDKEFEFLHHLVKNKGTIISKDELCRCVWELNFVPPTNICEATVRNLRRKLEEATGRRFIKNVYGEGYTLIAD